MTAANEKRRALLHVVRDEQDEPLMKSLEEKELPKIRKKRTRKTTQKKKSDSQAYGLPPQPQGYLKYPDHDFF